MADNFDPDAWAAKNGYQVPSASTAPPSEPTYEQKVAALQQRMEATKNAKPQASIPGWMAAPVGAVSAALPGVPGVAGGLGALAAGHTFGEGYKMGTQAQNNILGDHPVMGTLGAVGGLALSPISKAIGAATKGAPFAVRALANGAQGAAQGLGMATDRKSAGHGAALGGAAGILGTAASDILSGGLGWAGEKLGNTRSRLIDYFGSKGEEAIAANPKLSVLGNDANAIGAPGPKSVPELQTSQWLRTPEEQQLSRTAAKAVPILQRTRPESAIVQTMGPEYVGDVIGNKASNALAHRAESEPLFKALNRIGKLGGADIQGEQLSQNIKRTMAAKQLGPQSPLSSLFESATGQDLGESARRVATTADENLFYSPNAYDAGAKQMEKGARGYLERMGDNLANRHGGGYVPKPSVMAGKATVPAAGNNAATGVVDLSAPMVESAAALQPHSTFLGAGQPSSKINYSQYTPSEAADIGGAAERTNAINIGRQAAPTTQLSQMIQPMQNLPAKPGAMGHIARAYALATNPGRATLAQMLNPSTMETGAGMVGKAGQAIKGTGDALSKYVPPEQVTAAFLAAHIPKEEEQQP